MIQFTCKCGNPLTAADDQAGGDLQCPACGRLNSVPTLTDLAAMADDGTYKIEAPYAQRAEDANRAEELKRIFRKSRVDEYGREIDLRSHSEPLDYQGVGVDPLDRMPEGHDRPAAPKYDPETGELIRAVEVRPDPQTPRPALPPLKRPKQRYAIHRLPRVTPLVVWANMFRPTNLVVMLMLLIAHAVYFTGIFIGSFMWFALVLACILGLGILGHFGNVIDETGPANQDELPRPLRNLNWHEDLWGPFKATLVSAMLCYGPSLLVYYSLLPNPLMRMICIGMFAVLGTLIAPAVLLITQTSGTIVNLRPDRIWNTIRGCMPVYPMLIVLYVLSVPAYFGGFVCLTIYIRRYVKWTLSSMTMMRITPPTSFQWTVAIVAVLAGIWMINYYGWILGQVYRVYHSYFQWAYQGSLQQDELIDPQGFPVMPSGRRKAAVSNAPLPAMPVEETRTREERLADVRKSDQQRKKESDEMLKNLPDYDARGNRF